MDRGELENGLPDQFLDVGIKEETLKALLWGVEFSDRASNGDRWLRDKSPEFYKGMLSAVRIMRYGNVASQGDPARFEELAKQFKHEILTTLLDVIIINKENGSKDNSYKAS